MKLSKDQLLIFLKKVNNEFPVPLSEKQDLERYAEKLLEKATLCYKIDEKNQVIALVAGYTDCLSNNMAYISMVSTLPEYQGKGIATELVKKFINICIDKSISGIHLYAVEENTSAVKIYKKLGFRTMNIDNEKRPEDLHLLKLL